MQLINFSVSNFRSITSAHKVTVSNTTVLIGKNNEGKSNLLRALQVAMELLQRHALEGRRPAALRALSHRRGPYSWQRDFPVQLQERKTSTETTFKLEFRLDDEEIQEFREAIGANLNGTLPLEIKVGRDGMPDIRLRKSGKNTKSLSAKSEKIAHFIALRIFFNYIPAVRTDKEALEVVSGMLSEELEQLESDEDYQKALAVIKELQRPVLQDLAKRIEAPLAEFLPNIKSVEIEIPENKRRFNLRRDFNIIVDDGTPTSLEYKGDGVKSLAALGLLKHTARRKGASIIAIEEPESHLHPGAIHQLNEIVGSLSSNNQVIISTHNALFVDRERIKSNIIVDGGRATPAKSVAAIRDLLGIRASDNLTNANFALVVEGNEDAKALAALIPVLSQKAGKALKERTLIIEPVSGAGNLSYKLSLLKNSLCSTHALLDDDRAGRDAFDKAERNSLVSVATSTFTVCPNMQEAEFEDVLNVDLYRERVLDQFGVDLKVAGFRGNGKWSDRMKTAVQQNGKRWTTNLESQLKACVADAVVLNPKDALNRHKRQSIDSLVRSIDRMLGS